jgi:hypothetical protein
MEGMSLRYCSPSFLGCQFNSALDIGTNEAERCVRVGAERGDSGDADHDDERQHDGIFHCRWAIFILQEGHYFFRNKAHFILHGERFERQPKIAVSH